jgi:hypothetical protein
MSRRLAPLAALLPLLAGACYPDPVHDGAVAALGPEDPSVPPGPLHRPGQPCLICHDGMGPAAMVLEAGGTVVQNDTDATPTPVVAATVRLTDAASTTYVATTNCAGNFFVQAVDWAPTYPVHVAVDFGSTSAPPMTSHIGRATSCATCHTGTVATPSTVTRVYLDDEPMTYPPTGCP